MLKEQKTNIFVLGIVAIMAISLATTTAEAGLDIDAIFMTSCKGLEDGTPDGNPWVFELWVNLEDPGSLHHINVTLPGSGLSPFIIYEDPYCGWAYDSSPTDYSSLSALQTDYPTGIYTLGFYDSDGGLLNSVDLDYSSLPGEPTGHVNFTYPEYDGQTGIPTDPTFTWTVDPEAGHALAMWLSDGVTDEPIYENVPVSMTTNSWSPGSLQPNHYYDLTVSVFNAKDLGIGPALPIMTVGGDAFEYCLMIEYLNEINFTTIPALAIETTIDIDPDTLNLQSKGEWITCYIWLPEGYDVADIDPESILLNGQVAPDWGRVDETGRMLIVKFNRSEVQDILNVGEVELTISGELTDGTKFEGTDTITVIDKGGKK